MGTAQPGIFAEGSAHHIFLEYDVADAADLESVRAAMRSALSAPPDAPRAERAPEVVVAFGDALWRRLASDPVPDSLRAFAGVEGSGGRRAPATPHAVWLWLHGGHHDESFARALHVHRALAGVATLAVEEHGFTYRDSRDLTGFVDGTANPKGEDRQRAALVPDGSAGAGGSFVLTQRWIHDLAKFCALPVDEQERVIGRTKPDSIELEGDAMPLDSHVSRTDLKRDGVALEIYRRSAPIGTLREHGLYFLAFACDPTRFEILLESMFGVSGDGVHDRLIEFSRATTGAFYFAPSREELRAALG